MPKQTPEQKVTKEVLKYLRDQGHEVFPHKTIPTYDASFGGYRRVNHNSMTPGEPDLLVFNKNNPLMPMWLELKRKKYGKEGANQVMFKKRVEALGHVFSFVKGEDDCKKLGL